MAKKRQARTKRGWQVGDRVVVQRPLKPFHATILRINPGRSASATTADAGGGCRSDGCATTG